MARLTTAAGWLQLDGRPWFMRAAEMHYFRIERARWEPGLERLAGLGFNCISTYVPWIWHEPAPGQYDFDGATDPQGAELSRADASDLAPTAARRPAAQVAE